MVPETVDLVDLVDLVEWVEWVEWRQVQGPTLAFRSCSGVRG